MDKQPYFGLKNIHKMDILYPGVLDPPERLRSKPMVAKVQSEEELEAKGVRDLRKLANQLKIGTSGWRVTARREELVAGILRGAGPAFVAGEYKEYHVVTDEQIIVLGQVLGRIMMAEWKRIRVEEEPRRRRA